MRTYRELLAVPEFPLLLLLSAADVAASTLTGLALATLVYARTQSALMRPGPNRDYYLKKREHGRTHTQTVIVLARRRIDVLWALLRDNRPFAEQPPAIAEAA